MKTTKKHLLGLGGLALVTAMTAVAFSIPAPDASAYEQAAVSGEVVVQVKVYSGNPEIKINAPLDGTITTNRNITISNTYSDADSVDNILTFGNTMGRANTAKDLRAKLNIPVSTPANGDDAFTVDLRQFGGYDHYLLTSVLRSDESTLEDSVTFRYVPANITQIGTDANGDPIFLVEYDEGVNHVEIQIYDELGNPVLKEPFQYNVKNPDEGGAEEVTIPLGANKADTGDYLASVTPFGPVAEAEVENSAYDAASQTLTADLSWDDNAEVIYIQILDAYGQPIDLQYPYVIANPGTAGSDSIVIDLSDLDLSDFDLTYYEVIATPYAIANSTKNIDQLDMMHGPVSTNFHYTKPIQVPNTGDIMQMLNLSRADYLMTGLIAFGSTAIFALVFLARKKEAAKSTRRRR